MGKLIVISGPSGVGKGTIIKRVIKRLDNVKLSVSCTTRAPRPGEVNGVHYHFITKEQFEKMIAEEGFLEYESFFDNYYGTPRQMVKDEIEKGNSVILEIDVKGGMNVKRMEPDAMLIFIAPPNFDELKKRLENRNSETPEQIVQRVARATAEMRYSTEYDHVVINDDLDKAVEEVIGLIEEE
jgi:guanylate kinase